MPEKAKVPAIRFKGFTDAWEQRKFSETFIYLQNNSLSRADLNYEQGLVKNVHYGRRPNKVWRNIGCRKSGNTVCFQ